MSLQPERNLFRLGAAYFTLGITVFAQSNEFWDAVEVLSDYHADIDALYALWRKRDRGESLCILTQLCDEIADHICLRPNPCRSPLIAWLVVSQDFATRVLVRRDRALRDTVHEWVDVPENAHNDVPRAASTNWLDEVDGRIGWWSADDPAQEPGWAEQAEWIRTMSQKVLDDLPEEIRGPA